MSKYHKIIIVSDFWIKKKNAFSILIKVIFKFFENGIKIFLLNIGFVQEEHFQ